MVTPLSIKSYVHALLIPFAIAAVLFWLLALYMQPVTGDLTRIGRWTENDFGWNAPQPVINVLPNGRAVTNPDIVVLGDSFSLPNYWQSALSARVQQKIQSFTYEDAGCVDNWIRWAREHPSANTVVVQVVEHNFVSTFSTLAACKKSTPKPHEVAAGKIAATRALWPPTLDAKYLFITAFNTLKMQLRSNATIRHGEVINSPIKPDCAKFSHKRADRLLHFSQDERKLRWTPRDIDSAIANARRLQHEITRAGKRFVFVVAPDKSSVYRHCMAGQDTANYPNVMPRLAQAGIHGPDLLSAFKANSNVIADLYHPDNTHWSERGHIFAAGEIEKFVRP